LFADYGRRIVTGGDKLLQAKVVKAQGEIFEKIAFVWIIAVA
jgi:hypothetical protein